MSFSAKEFGGSSYHRQGLASTIPIFVHVAGHQDLIRPDILSSQIPLDRYSTAVFTRRLQRAELLQRDDRSEQVTYQRSVVIPRLGQSSAVF